jgi:hypothetical protein
VITLNVTDEMCKYHDNGAFDTYLAVMKQHVRQLHKLPWFYSGKKVDYMTFLMYLPQEARQHYNCNACRTFLERYGNLVALCEDGKPIPVCWVPVAEHVFTAATAYYFNVLSNSIAMVPFKTRKITIGDNNEFPWKHFNLTVPEMARTVTPNKTINDFHERMSLAIKATEKLSVKDINLLINWFHTGVLHRGYKFKPMLEAFKQFKIIYRQLSEDIKITHNRLKYFTYMDKTNSGRIMNTVIGQLLKELNDGVDSGIAIQRFNKRVAHNYQRPQAAPKVGQVRSADRFVIAESLKPAFQRRLATVDEIQHIWQPNALKGLFTEALTGGHVLLKKSENMSWQKFESTYLRKADEIHLLTTEATARNMCQLTTAYNPDSKPIIVWDTEKQRNPVAWYLHARSAGLATWGIFKQAVEVVKIAKRPNMWHDNFLFFGDGRILILKDCYDHSYEKVRLGLFPEILKSNLRPYRRTIEAFCETQRHKFAYGAAGGYMVQASNMKPFKLRVTVDGITQVCNITSWD